MTKEEIFKIVLAALLAGFLRPIIEAFMPSKDRLKVYVKKALNITFSYLFPIAVLATTFLGNSPVDKYFLFKALIFSMILILNINLDLFLYSTSNIRLLKQEIIESFETVIRRFSDIHHEHIDVSNQLFDIHKEDRDKVMELMRELVNKVNKLEENNGGK